ncbi:putative presequence translocase [Diplogelasinospora grovesii]|uniref:Presequence translocated-associated motor subunit PAM17 n=1 Tax=Diplogelasinospora grovesii TaxID=303347 RepID=A0AAN6N977_9PEZI|nr:putative presequence translocase [Diplogelasinospora grovesii]
MLVRSGVARSATAGLQPILFRSAACPYSTNILNAVQKEQCQAVRQPCMRRSLSTTTTKPAPKMAIRFPKIQRRNASTVQRTDQEIDASAAATAAAAQNAAHPGEAAGLDWNTFFRLRKTRRRWQQGFSIVTALTSSAGGALFLSTGAAEVVVAQIPLDPLVTLGLMTTGFAAMGWLVGPIIGSQVFNMLKSKYKSQMAVKESQFFARIKKHRVDPSASSMGNPVPDFYGEKISSVAGYRQWLKDQRAFNKKRTTFV